MRNIHRSGVALAVLVLAASPASAQLLNLGGGGGGNSGISINLGGNDSDGGLLNLGGSGTGGADADVGVQVNLRSLGGGGEGLLSGTLVDIDGDGDGNLLDLNGVGIGNQQVHVDLFGIGRNGETQLAVGTGGNDEVIVNLFGAQGQGQTATANILPRGTQGLFGGADVALDLFGPGSGSGAGGGVGGGFVPPVTGSGVPDDPEDLGLAVAAGIAVGGARSNAGCFSPTSEQIGHLLARNSYGGGAAASWGSASEVNVVSVNVCRGARARVAQALEGDPNIGVMQSAVASSRLIRARLGSQYQPDDVLAVDQSGEDVTVYVY